MQMNNVMIIVLLCLALVAGGIFVVSILSDDLNETGMVIEEVENYGEELDEGTKRDLDGGFEKELTISVSGQASSEGVGESAGVNDGGDEEKDNGVGLPVDIDDVECGFYFEEYGACRGTCPSGECETEGRSCYCKKI